MYARKISQIAESRRHLRRESGSLTYRRARRKTRKASSKREMAFSRRRPLFLVLLFLVTQYYFLESPLFQFREVSINGSERIPRQSIEERLGLDKEHSYWELSPEALQASLASLHRVQEAQVEVAFPGRVDVRVEERQPSFFVAFIGNSKNWFTVDAEGVVLESSAPNSRRLRVLLTRPIREGSRMRKSDLQVIRFFQDNLNAELQQQVRAVKLAENGDVALRVKFGSDSIWVRLGRPEKLQYKLFLLQELLVQLAAEKESILGIDLRYSAPVVTKEIKQEQPEGGES